MLFPAGLAALWCSAIRIKARLRRLRGKFRGRASKSTFAAAVTAVRFRAI
jgi:hypothetical protein